MSQIVPGPWEFVLLALGAFRLSRLIGWDTITAGLRERITGFTDDNAASIEDLPSGGSRSRRARVYLSTMIRCPWCQGFYVSALVYVAWVGLPRLTLASCAVLSISSAVGLIAKNLDP